MIRSGALWAGACICVLGALTGCNSAEQTSTPHGPLPEYTELARAHNENISRFGSLWAYAVASISYTDAKGDRVRDQGEGHLQFVRPDRLALDIGKLGEVIVWLGSDGERFWFIEPTAEPPTALLGLNEELDAEARERLGMPVRPGSIGEALGLSLLPLEASAPGVFDEAIGAVEFSLPGRRVAFEPASGRLVRVAFLDESGDEVAISTLTGETEVMIEGVSGFFPRIAERVEIVDASSGDSFRVTLSRAREKAIKDRVFVYEYLFTAFRVERVRGLE